MKDFNVIDVDVTKIKGIDFCNINYGFCYSSFLGIKGDVNDFINSIIDNIKYHFRSKYSFLYNDNCVIVRVKGLVDFEFVYNH